MSTKPQSASAFIRTLPIDLPEAQVIKRAARRGITIRPGLTRVVRHKMRKESAYRRAFELPKIPIPRLPLDEFFSPIGSGRTRLARATSNDDLAFRSIVQRVGLRRAKELLVALVRTGAAA